MSRSRFSGIWPLFCLVCLLASVPRMVTAQDPLEDLVSAGRLSVSTSLSPNTGAIVTQKVNLSIEIATDRWFAGGTAVGSLEVNNAIVLHRQKFALNSTRRLNGKTWAIQRWDLEIYPQSKGTYMVPPVEIGLTISGDSGSPVRGTVLSNPVSFTASVPEGAPESGNWMATAQLSITESWDKSPSNLMVGKARQRTVTIKAEDSPAMLIPALPNDELAGLSAYPKPVKVFDNIGRSESQGIREESVTYFFEEANHYTLPEIQVHWWNLTDKRWEVATLPSVELQIEQDSSLTVAQSSQPLEKGVQVPIKRITALAVAALLVIGSVWGLIRINGRRLRNRTVENQSQSQSEKFFWKNLNQAIKSEDPVRIINALYKWLSFSNTLEDCLTLSEYAGIVERERLSVLFEQLLESFYGTPIRPYNQIPELKSELVRVRRRSGSLFRKWKSLFHSRKDLSSLNPSR